MVFSSGILVRVVDASAAISQYAARIQDQDRLGAHQLLDLICCIPLHHLGRLILCLWTYLCVSVPDSYYYSSDSDSDSYSDGGDGTGGGGASSSATADYVDLDYDSNSD